MHDPVVEVGAWLRTVLRGHYQYYGVPYNLRAAELIARAIQVSDAIEMEWPQAWYWLGRALFEQGELAEALTQTNRGLELLPHYSALLNLKAAILSRLWRKDPAHKTEALSFFRYRVAISSADYASVAELARLYDATSQLEAAQTLMIDHMGLPHAAASYLHLTSANLETHLRAIRHFQRNMRYRQRWTIREYIEALRNQGLGPDEDFEVAMTVECAVTFGHAYDIVAAVPAEKRDRVARKAYRCLLDSLGAALPRLSVKLLRAIEVDSVESAIDGLSGALACWPLIARLELSREFGFIGGALGVSNGSLVRTLSSQGKRLQDFQRDIASDTLLAINGRLKLFRDA